MELKTKLHKRQRDEERQGVQVGGGNNQAHLTLELMGYPVPPTRPTRVTLFGKVVVGAREVRNGGSGGDGGDDDDDDR
eukprot:2546013-Amphidinium_carterae.1